MADSVFPMFKLIPTIKKMMLRLKWESNLQVPFIKTPMFFISGDVDNFVPTALTYELFNKSVLSKYKELWIVAGGNHNNTFMMAGPAYFTRVASFFDKCLIEAKKPHPADLPKELVEEAKKEK